MTNIVDADFDDNDEEIPEDIDEAELEEINIQFKGEYSTNLLWRKLA